MKTISCCPFCQGELVIEAVRCGGCATEIKGQFLSNRFQMFKEEELFFIELFLKNEGNIKLMEKDLGISYPTVKNRLKQIITQLGYKAPTDSGRMGVLDALAAGDIDVKSAVNALKGEK